MLFDHSWTTTSHRHAESSSREGRNPGVVLHRNPVHSLLPMLRITPVKYWTVLISVIALAACERRPPPGASTQTSSAVVSASAPASSTLDPVASFASDAPSPPSPLGEVPRASGSYREVTWRFEGTRVGDMTAVVVIPQHAGPDHRLPVVITMHGLGEALKGPKKGARGWVDDYWLPKALRRLHSPPLRAADFRNRSDPARLALINKSLERQPYRGVIVVCPYTPHEVLKGERAFGDGKVLADFLVDELIPKIYEETPAIGTPATTGVDGVSLGGRAAVLVGLARPEAFGALGALQPAFDVEDASRLAKRAAEARKKNPGLTVRLLTSDGDYYLASTKAISAAMTEAGVDNTLDVVPGDHSYDFNRGPGVYEMLFFHDRALRSEDHLPGAP